MAVRVNIITGYNGSGSRAAMRDLDRMAKAAEVAGAGVTAGMLKASGGMQRAGDKMAQIGASATTKITLPLAAVGTYAFNTASEFETSMNQVAAATGAPADEMAKLTELAKKMGAETIYSANDASTAMLELAKSGMTPAQISAGGLQATMLLAAAGGVDLGSAATTTSNALNMFGMSADQANVVANALAGGANASAASVDGLQQSLSQVGPGARNAGLDLNQTVGVLAAFADKGIQGSDAGTSLKTMLARLVPQTDAQAKAMKRLGLDFVDSKGNIDDITTVAAKLQDKLGGLSEAERNAALQTIFGSDATRAATVLMQEGEDGIQKYIDATKDQAAAQAMADARMGGSAGAMERMKGSVETAALSLGQALAPAVTDVAGVIEKLANSFASLSPETQGLIVKLALAAAAFGPVMSVVGKVTSGAGRLLGGVGKLTLAFGDGAAEAPKWARAIAGGVKGTVDLAKNIATTIANLGRQAIAWGVDTAKKVANTAATWASIAAQKAAAIGAKLWAGAQWLLNAAMNANPIGLVVAAIVALIAIFVVAWNKSEKFREIVTGAWEAVKDAAIALWQWISKTFKQIALTLALAWMGIQMKVRAVWDWIVDAFRKYGGWILAALTGPIGLLAKFLIDNWDKIKAGAVKVWTSLVSWIKGIPGKILDALGDMGQLLYNAGKAVIEGFWNGLKAMWNKVTGWVTGIGDWIADHKGPIEKDRKLLEPAGLAIMQGLQTGLSAGWRPVASTLDAMTARIAGTSFTTGGVALAGVSGGLSGGSLAGIGGARGGGVVIGAGAVQIQVAVTGGTSIDEARAIGGAAGEEAARRFLSRIAREKRRG